MPLLQPAQCAEATVQNTAARILTRTRKYEHIATIPASLHRLPVTFRIDFKMLLLVFKSLSGLAPSYVIDLLSPYTPARTLRSAEQPLLSLPGARPEIDYHSVLYYNSFTHFSFVHFS